MYVLIAGGGQVGANLTRSLLRSGNEVTLIEQKPYRFDKLEAEFEHQVIRGDATELYVLERAGIKRPPDLLVATIGEVAGRFDERPGRRAIELGGRTLAQSLVRPHLVELVADELDVRPR